MDQEVRAEGASPRNPATPTHVSQNKIGPQDDPEAFTDLFEKSAKACGWPREHWLVCLKPLLSGEENGCRFGEAMSIRSWNVWCRSSLSAVYRGRLSVGPVPLTNVSGPGHSAGGGPDGGMPRGQRIPASSGVCRPVGRPVAVAGTRGSSLTGAR